MRTKFDALHAEPLSQALTPSSFFQGRLSLSKVRAGNFFEDFAIGMTFKHAAPRTLTEGDRSFYIALTGTRAALVTAATNAETLGFSQRPLDDMLVFNAAFGKTVSDVSMQARGNLGYANVRFLEHVYDGDTLIVESKVVGLRENSNGQSGIVYVQTNARNQHGVEVLTYVRWVMINKKDPGTPCPISVVPDLPETVAPADLASKRYGPDVGRIVALTGSDFLWEDYAVGERLDHPMGTTIYQSDHTLATRLYQNNARGHFDGIMMEGRPLVYGGHIISTCTAAMHDGFENALGLLGINGGTHVAPTFGGDTVRCATQVVEKIEIGSTHVGALRLRTLGAKNIRESGQIEFPARGEGKIKYDPSVVLDLDYTIAIPKVSTSIYPTGLTATAW